MTSPRPLLRLHRNFTALRDQTRLDAFAYQIARNAIIDHYRGRARSRENLVTPEDLAGHLDQPEFDDGDGDLAALQDWLVSASPANQLSEPSRTALLLTDLGDVSQAEAARAAGISAPGMKSRVQRARSQLLRLLSECCTVTFDQRRQITEVERTGPCACTKR